MTRSTTTIPDLITEQILRWTGRRVRNLTVEMTEERVVLRGLAPSYYVKQLALQGVRESLPAVEVQNAISVA